MTDDDDSKFGLNSVGQLEPPNMNAGPAAPDDRCDECKTYDEDGCPNCGPWAIFKTYGIACSDEYALACAEVTRDRIVAAFPDYNFVVIQRVSPRGDGEPVGDVPHHWKQAAMLGVVKNEIQALEAATPGIQWRIVWYRK